MKWTKFSDIRPSDGMKSIWLYDGKYVSSGHPDNAVGHDGYTHWMERPLPPEPLPPEKEKHECINLEADPIPRCYVSEEGILYLEARSLTGKYCPYPIKFCPFCGFTLEDK